VRRLRVAVIFFYGEIIYLGKTKIMSFKLIAIRATDQCNTSILKNIEKNKIYNLSNQYIFKEVNNSVEISKNINSNYVDLYSQNIEWEKGEYEKLNINISAIVGKNGSGKSSLMELLYLTFYKIARIIEIIKLEPKTPQKTEVSEHLKLSSKLRDTARNIEEYFPDKIKDPLFEKNLNDQYISLWYQLNNILKENEYKDYDANTDGIGLQIYYEIDEVLYSLNLVDSDLRLIVYKTENLILSISTETIINCEEKFKELSHLLFYNLVINYSLYGLNSEESGNWIEKLFHKNDSYQTPIVLNPFRDKGNIDINSENHLVRSRLLAIIFAKDVNNKEIAKGKEIKKVKLVFKEKKLVDQDVYWDRFINFFFPKLYTYFFTDPIDGKLPDLNNFDFASFDIKTGQIYIKTLEYILRKIDSIVERYPTFKKFAAIKDDEFVNSELENSLIIALFQDRSHISLKVKQALNFYKYQSYVDDEIIEKEKIFPISVLTEEINSYHKLNDFIDLIEFIPPPFFKLELYFEEENDSNNFSNLSSGEKQRIYSLNSIVYHIRNLLSVNKNPDDKLIIYKNFNIILDEIELYYHPELQRTFISDLIEYILKIDFKDRYRNCIPNINIIFITHSPFILSDIPKQNILFLDIDQSSQKSKPQIYEEDNTFASNIHEMLTKGFFMQSTKGEFALTKIKEFLNFYQKVYDNKDYDLKALKIAYINRNETFKKIINLIGEDQIRNILHNHIDFIEKKLDIPESVQSEIERLKEKIKLLEKKNNEEN